MTSRVTIRKQFLYLNISRSGTIIQTRQVEHRDGELLAWSTFHLVVLDEPFQTSDGVPVTSLWVNSDWLES